MPIPPFNKFKHFIPIILILIINENGSCKYVHKINIALRLQVKNFLMEHLRQEPPKTTEDLYNLFEGLSLYNDHYRSGGILDFCREIGMVSNYKIVLKIIQKGKNRLNSK